MGRILSHSHQKAKSMIHESSDSWLQPQLSPLYITNTLPQWRLTDPNSDHFKHFNTQNFIMPCHVSKPHTSCPLVVYVAQKLLSVAKDSFLFCLFMWRIVQIKYQKHVYANTAGGQFGDVYFFVAVLLFLSKTIFLSVALTHLPNFCQMAAASVWI